MLVKGFIIENGILVKGFITENEIDIIPVLGRKGKKGIEGIDWWMEGWRDDLDEWMERRNS